MYGVDFVPLSRELLSRVHDAESSHNMGDMDRAGHTIRDSVKDNWPQEGPLRVNHVGGGGAWRG